MNYDLYIAAYTTSIPLIFFFALYAFYIGYKSSQQNNKKTETLTNFLAAHKSQPLSRVIYSFISTSLGAWVVFSPSSYALTAGYIGLMTYSISAGITILIPGIFGPYIQANSTSISLSDFVGKRYGVISQYFISILCLYSMIIGLVAEYTAIGDLFEFIIGANRIAIVTLIGLLTSLYTAYGGLSVSIKTDQLQGIFVLTMNIVFAFYMIFSFNLDTSQPLPSNLDANDYGYNSIVAMPLGLAGSVVFSEAFWQKAWVASSNSDLKKGSIVASIVIIIVVFLFGFYGFIAAWSGYVSDSTNLALFAIFKDQKPTWILVILTNMAVIMNESAVDSYQIGIVSTISTCFLKDKPLWMTQILVIIINIPIIILSLQSYGIMNLFLSANLITAAASIPLLLGLWEEITLYYGSFNLLCGSFGGLICALIWAIINQEGLQMGAQLIFFDCYCWESFIIVTIGSMIIALGISFFRMKMKWETKKRTFFKEEKSNVNLVLNN